MSLNFEYYKVFYYVATYQNITRAAEHLCLTQPSVTKSIQNLEKQLRCVLFERTKRGVNLTPAGKELYQKVRSACMELFLAEKDMEQRRVLEQGMLRICTGVASLNSVLLETIRSFHRQYPGISIDIYDNHSGFQMSSMEQGEFDILLDLAPVDTPFEIGYGNDIKRLPDNSTICLKTLGSITDVPVVGPDYFHLAERKLSMEDLHAYPMIFRKLDTLPQGFYHPYLQKKQLIGRTSHMIANSLPVRIFMTKTNLGISFMPKECIAEELKAGNLMTLDVSERLLERRFVLFHKEAVQCSFATRRFLELLDASISGKELL